MKKRRTQCITSLVIAMLAVCTFAESPSAELFAKPFEYRKAILSPDGKHIVVERAAEEGKTMVAIVRTKDLKLMGHIPAGKKVAPTSPIWVSNNRITVRHTEKYSYREAEYLNGELTAMDVDGKKMHGFVRHQNHISWGGKAKNNGNTLHGYAEVVHNLPNNPRRVIVSFNEFKRNAGDQLTEYFSIDTITGKTKQITIAPSYKATINFSPDGIPRYSFGIDKALIEEGNLWVAHQYANEKWQPLAFPDIDARELTIISDGDSDEDVIIWAKFDNKTDSIYSYNFKTQQVKLIFSHATVDPSHVDIDSYTNKLIAVHYDDGYSNMHIVDKEHVYGHWYPILFKYFGGLSVRITSASIDGVELIVHASGDKEPGQFHLFNTKTKKMRYLFNAASWIDTKTLATKEPIAVTARDGLQIQGYITKPGNGAKSHPLVVLPHGGPHGVRDWWKYDREVQFLASRGYAVLQINFRGSGGYGRKFEAAGYRKWGREIQYDIIDATLHVAAQQDIDADRMCIVGASFGGYSALMSPIIEPDLFKCAVGAMGVYDLSLMWSTGDIEESRTGENYLAKAIGNDKVNMEEFSPAQRADELKAPVLLVHGERDRRVDIKHFHVMHSALKALNHDHETLLFKKEDHGFGSEENLVEYFNVMVNFLDKHIGGIKSYPRRL